MPDAPLTLFDPDPEPEPAPARGETAASVEVPPVDLASDTGFRIVVRRSVKRKRTVGAELRDGVLHIALPSWMSAEEEMHWVAKMEASFARKQSADRIDLTQRALTLSRRHELPRARDIRWADDMKSRWGSCTINTASIRLSNRLAAYPDWVIDYVIVHELCHLEVRGHGPDFWRLVHRYPKAERAIGYLIAKSGDDSELDEG